MSINSNPVQYKNNEYTHTILFMTELENFWRNKQNDSLATQGYALKINYKSSLSLISLFNKI